MARITLRLPDGLHRRLGKAASRRRTSLNQLILECLEEALPADAATSSTSRQEELRRVKAAVGAMEIDVEAWIDRLGLSRDVPSREEVFASFPRLDPPLSQTIIEDRIDRG